MLGHKDRTTALVLSGLFGFIGMDRFYIGHVYVAGWKLLMTALLLVVWPWDPKNIDGHVKEAKGGVQKAWITALSAFVAGAVISWWIVDFILILNGQLRDRTGLQIY